MNGLAAPAFDQFFEVSEEKRTRGHSKKLVKRRCRLDLRKQFFTERVVSIWMMSCPPDQSIFSRADCNGKWKTRWIYFGTEVSQDLEAVWGTWRPPVKCQVNMF